MLAGIVTLMRRCRRKHVYIRPNLQSLSHVAAWCFLVLLYVRVLLHRYLMFVQKRRPVATGFPLDVQIGQADFVLQGGLCNGRITEALSSFVSRLCSTTGFLQWRHAHDS